jgi:NAD(P)-dependent dehydrogenase (short-subunit alcohol dehydrogenase family)
MGKNQPRLIVLTGATRGLGRSLVNRFQELGHTVVGCGRNKAIISELRTAFPGPSRFDSIDVTDDSQVATWVKSWVGELGSPDLLINNAAQINHHVSLWEVTAPEMDRIIRTNVIGVLNVIRHVVPAMLKRETGVIVNLSSYWGRSTSPGVGQYCASKWAIEGMTSVLAQELAGTKLAAIPLNPGIIDTDMLKTSFGASSGRYMGPEEWSYTAAPFLLELSHEHNGQPLTVPGQ